MPVHPIHTFVTARGVKRSAEQEPLVELLALVAIPGAPLMARDLPLAGQRFEGAKRIVEVRGRLFRVHPDQEAGPCRREVISRGGGHDRRGVGQQTGEVGVIRGRDIAELYATPPTFGRPGGGVLELEVVPLAGRGVMQA